MSLYSGLAATAARLIAQFGQACTITRTTGSGTSAVQVGAAVRDTLNEGDRRRLSGPAGEMPIGSAKYLIDGSVTPQRGDLLALGGASALVEIVDPIQPGDTVLAWQVLAVGA